MAAELIYPNFLIWMENFHNLCWGSPDHGRSIVLGNWTIYFGFGPFRGGVVTKQDTSTDDRAAGPGKLRENRPLVGKMSLVGVKASICLWGARAVTSPITTHTSPTPTLHLLIENIIHCTAKLSTHCIPMRYDFFLYGWQHYWQKLGERATCHFTSAIHPTLSLEAQFLMLIKVNVHSFFFFFIL